MAGVTEWNFARRSPRPPRRSLRAARGAMEILESRLLMAANAPSALLGPASDPLVAVSEASTPSETAGEGAIRGLKWSDLNANSIRDSGEPGLAGVTIYLDANDNGALDPGEMSTVTAPDDPQTPLNETGAYAFTGLAAGSYVVREVVPAGFDQTYPLVPASQFDIEIIFPDNSLTPAQQAYFEDAAARWEEIIIGELPDANSLRHRRMVDDILIEATGPAIDGRGGTLGQAGPREFRSQSRLPISGMMQFDSADIAELIDDGQFDEVILHEMGHVLGFGTLWSELALLSGFGTETPRFTGQQAAREYNSLFGATGASVPVEGDEGGGGTLYSHWDDDTFDNELMTGFLNPGEPNPISRITVAQMADLGYVVDLAAADAYAKPIRAAAALLAEPAPRGRLEVLDLPRTYIDEEPVAAQAKVARTGRLSWIVELGDGETVDNVDFGNAPRPGSISGAKWNDRDGDAVRDANEPGLEGWTIFLDFNGNRQLDQSLNEPIAITDAAGNYRFADLPPGAYVVVEQQQPAWVQTYPLATGAHEVSLAPGQELVGVDFGNRTGFIGGVVWNDRDGDGVQGDGEPGLAGWTVFLDRNGNGALDDGVETFSSGGDPLDIRDSTTAVSRATVSGLGLLADVDVALNIAHTYVADLDVYLTSPQGTRVELFTDIGANGDNLDGAVLDDEAPGPIGAGTAPFAGRFRPEGLLSKFDGEDPNGVWTLEITDDSASDQGSLLGWSLTIRTQETATTTDPSGAYAFVDLPPGEYRVSQVAQSSLLPTFPASSASRLIALSAGQLVRDVNFGNRAAAISGRKWQDLNRNGEFDSGETGLEGQIVFIDDNGNGAFDEGSITLASSAVTPIVDLGSTESTIEVSGLPDIVDVDVTIDVIHTDVADLDVVLVSPAGTRVELFSDVGPGGRNLQNTTLDDEAPLPIVGGTAPFAGRHRPEGLLATFDGENPNGQWTLEITDDAGNDVGTLVSWSLTLATRDRFVVTDAAGRYAFHDLPPGNYFVGAIQESDWVTTFPNEMAFYLLSVAAGQQVERVDFGAHATALVGDYDGDQDVDGADFLAWQRGLGSSASPAGSDADGDSNGLVDAGDLGVWRQSYGAVAAALARAAAPPPASARAAAFAQLGLTPTSMLGQSRDAPDGARRRLEYRPPPASFDGAAATSALRPTWRASRTGAALAPHADYEWTALDRNERAAAIDCALADRTDSIESGSADSRN